MRFTGRLSEAFAFAMVLHGEQRRKGTETPYITHLMSVAALVGEYGGDEDLAIAAMLHDAVEDQGGAPVLKQIRTRFGDRVARVVADCSDTDEVPKPPWRKRKEEYIEHLGSAQADTALVSAADKLHNVRTIIEAQHQMGDAVFERFNSEKGGTLWYYRTIVDTLKCISESVPIVRALEREVAEMERLAGRS
jgi:(p)ppGpp synthase/HD superfamily hydrolase